MGLNVENRFIKQFAVIGSSTFFNMILGLLSTPIITRIVEPNEYGQLSIFTMYSSIALMILCLGLDQAMVRYYYERDDIEYKRALLFRCVILPVVACVIVSIIAISLSMTHLFNFEFNTLILFFLSLHTFDQIVYRFSQLIVRLEGNVKLFSILQILQKIIYIILSIGLCYTIKRNYLLLLVIATTISYLICMVVSIVAQRNVWNFLFIKKGQCDIQNKELLQYSIPFIFSMSITTFFQAIDKIFLNY